MFETFFLNSSDDIYRAYNSNYDIPMVIVSVLIAVFSSCCAFEIVERLASRVRRKFWLPIGAGILGVGVWAMHFIGMLAFRIDCGVSYDPWITGLSMLPGIFAATVTLEIIASEKVSFGKLLFGGIAMALGICVMHFSGMAAIQLDGVIRYDPVLFIFSLAAAVGLAIMALLAKTFLARLPFTAPPFVSSLIAGSLLGGAISSMHYIAMKATYFIHEHPNGNESVIIANSPKVLAISVVVVAILLIFNGLLFTFLAIQITHARKRIEAILNTTSQGYVRLDINNMITECNQAMSALVGAGQDKLLGKPYCDLIASDNCAAMQGNYQAEAALLRADGSTLSCFVHGNLVTNEKGEMLFSFALFSDITERKEVEARLRALFNNSAIGMVAIDERGNIEEFNPASEAMFAYSKGEVIGQNINMLMPELFHNDHNGYLKNYLMSGSAKMIGSEREMLGMRKGNKIFPILLLVDEVDLGSRRIFVGYIKDISKRKQMEITSRHFEAIIQSSNDAIISKTMEGIVTSWNASAERMFGYTPEEMIGSSILKLFPPERVDEEKIILNKIAKKQLVEHFETIRICKDGSPTEVSVTLSPIIDEMGKIIGASKIVRDITQNKQMERELEIAKRVAEAASLSKSEFLANMSHEIRTPMNGVLGLLDLLRETKLTPIQLDWVQTAQSSAETLLEIINAILDLSKLEAGKFEVEQVDFNLVDLVEDICALLAGKAHKKKLELNCLLPVSMPLNWRGDPLRIRQVLTNLIGNAVKFTLQGEVSVSVNWPPLTDNQNGPRFEIHDTGIGISSEAQLQLFQLFSQVDSTTSRRFGGSGLGLFISKKLVELMGGAIGMSSVPGKGSCFWFTLPLEQSERQETSAELYDLSGKRALIVDDNVTNRTILNNYLGRWGLEVSEADNGSAALMTLQTSAIQGVIYDLILLDMQMPVMDGLTLAKCLFHIPSLAKIPVILLSSSDQFDLADYQNTGIRQCLMKPVRQLQLFDAIVNALQGVSEVTTNPAESEIQLPGYKGKKILVVEDNKINQKVIIAKLGKFDIVPDLAENGQAALDKLAQSAYDLIFMDCQMPVMDGYTATRELRLLETSKGLPHQTVIALTANALEGDLEKCLAAGMDDYLSKPIVSGQLMDILACRLGGQNTEIPPVLLNENICPAEKGMIVWDEGAALKHLEGDSELLYEMIELYLVEGPKQLSDLSRFQAEGNLLALADIAHAIKGTTAHFYADTATACASLLEQTARSGQPADFPGMTEALVKAVTDLINTLQLAKNAKNRFVSQLITFTKKG